MMISWLGDMKKWLVVCNAEALYNLNVVNYEGQDIFPSVTLCVDSRPQILRFGWPRGQHYEEGWGESIVRKNLPWKRLLNMRVMTSEVLVM